VRSWDDDYLVASMGNAKLSVAVTPNGSAKSWTSVSPLLRLSSRADAVTRGSDDKLYFVEPHVEKMTMAEFLSPKPSRGTGEPQSQAHPSEIRYLQSQNGNVYSNRFFEGTADPSEFEALRPDIPCEISWCSEAFGT
jgi:jumonji domain-containing protein 7